MLLFFLMLKWTKILLYLEQKQNCFTIQEHVTLLVDFLKKKKKTYKTSSRRKKKTAKSIADKRFTNVTLQSFKCLHPSFLFSQPIVPVPHLTVFVILE